MFVRNCLRAGDYLVPIPYGVPVTLEYDDGKLSKIYRYYDDEKQAVSAEDYTVYSELEGVVKKVPIKVGRTWVRGVLYSGYHAKCGGYVPADVMADLAEDVKASKNYKFYAADVLSNSTAFHGAGPVRQWLKMAGFTIIAGQLVPANVDQKIFDQMWDSRYPFEYPLMTYYFIWRGSDTLIVNTFLLQEVCKSVSKYLTEDGLLRGKVSCETGNTVDLDYYQIYKYNIHKGVTFIMNANHIVYSSCNDKQAGITCSVCGKRYVPTQFCHCDDTHCLSLKFKTANNLLSAFNAHPITFDRYKQLIKNKEILCVGDVLNTDEYLEYSLETSLYAILRALIDIDIVRNDDLITSFVNYCNNNIDSLKYYMDNPDRAVVDFDLDESKYFDLLNWFKDAQNVQDVINVIDNPRYNASYVNKLFDGPPIFRDKKIYITGKFKHGSTNDIISIFNSYGATTTNTFDTDVNCVVIGDMLENIDGRSVKYARNMNIPIFSEEKMFDLYDIDSDIQQNLQ